MLSLKVLVHGEAAEGPAQCVARAFSNLGHEAGTFDATRHDSHVPRLVRGRYAVPGLRALATAAANRRFRAHVQRTKPDLVVVMKGKYLFPGAIRAARASCGFIVNWFPDGVTELHGPGILESLSEYDRVFTKEPYVFSRLRAAGYENVSRLPWACDPSLHRPIALRPRDQARYGAEVSLVGSAYPYRLALLRALPLSEFQLRIWGRGWGGVRGELRRACVGAEAVGMTQSYVFNASRINLNTAHLQDIGGVNQRTFEVAGCGGFQLAPAQADLPGLFEPGREVVAYKDAPDLIAKIRYYLARDDEREAIAAAGQRRAYREHTYVHRIEHMLAELKL